MHGMDALDKRYEEEISLGATISIDIDSIVSRIYSRSACLQIGTKMI